MPDAKNIAFKFPSNFRFIPEYFQTKEIYYIKIFCFSFVTTFLLVSIMLKGYQLFLGIQTLHAATMDRAVLNQESRYWQDVIARHPGYRDAEFKLAVLSYQLGEKDKSKHYLQEALIIDPNFKEGREFAKQVGL